MADSEKPQTVESQPSVEENQSEKGFPLGSLQPSISPGVSPQTQSPIQEDEFDYKITPLDLFSSDTIDSLCEGFLEHFVPDLQKLLDGFEGLR